MHGRQGAAQPSVAWRRPARRAPGRQVRPVVLGLRIPALRRRLVTLALAIAGAAGGTSQAAEPLDLVPADSLLVWSGRPLPDTSPPSSQPSALATLLDLGTRIAGRPLDGRAQLTARLLETFGLMIRYPHALALIDAQARPGDDPESRRVDRLRMVLVVRTGGANEPFLQVIQKAVNEQTSAESARLTAGQAGGHRYQELRDRRVPDWCVVAWGALGQDFVVTLGDGVWPLVAATAAGELPSLSRDPWVVSARSAHGATPLIEIIVSARRIRERLDPLVHGRASEFFKAWDAEGIDRAHWSLGFVDRAMFCIAHFEESGATRRRVWAHPDFADPALLEAIPPHARYAVYQVPARQLLPRLISSLLATRSAETRQLVRERWSDWQRTYQFDPQAGLLDHLGDVIILHNDPPHPLRLPLAMTTLTQIRTDPLQVRHTLDRICSAWRDAVADPDAQPRASDAWSLERDDDGIWYVRLGPVAGPAWTVTERFLVTSWSPAALRMYLAKARPSVGRPLE